MTIVRHLVFMTVGIIFGIIMTKSEVVSWYRIQEMFRFDSFHMYGVIGVALILGSIIQLMIKKFKINDLFGDPIVIADKPKTYKASIIGGSIFGLGWALTGACPGPLYVLFGHGYIAAGLMLIGAVIGALLYAAIMKKLPH